MSWYVEKIVKTKAKAAEIIEAEQYIPAEFKAAFQARIATLAISEGAAIHIKTAGHLDPSGGNADFTLRQILLVE